MDNQIPVPAFPEIDLTGPIIDALKHTWNILSPVIIPLSLMIFSIWLCRFLSTKFVKSLYYREFKSVIFYFLLFILATGNAVWQWTTISFSFKFFWLPLIFIVVDLAKKIKA